MSQVPAPYPNDPTCVFCKIIAGQIPCHRVFEDDAVLAILDIGPIVRGHTLVLPKAHHPTLLETPGEVVAAIGRRLGLIARAVQAAVGAPASHILVNNGPEAMQSVMHLHFHILPRHGDGDGFHIPWQAGTLDKAAAAALLQSIGSHLRF